MISRIVVYISRALGDGLSLYMLYLLGSRVLSAWTSIFRMLTGGSAVLRCPSLLGCNRHIKLSTHVAMVFPGRDNVPGLI